MNNRLTPFQLAVLDAFFVRDPHFCLTGGAALAGYHLGHRSTYDLDLFSTDSTIEAGEAALTAAAQELGATMEKIQTAPTFRRWLLRRGEESVIVDLFLDTTPQRTATKPIIGAVRVDPPEEIVVNKLCALLSRAELRDLVDLQALEAAGYPAEEALPFAQAKDRGMTPAQLAWVLSQIHIGKDASIPGGGSATGLSAYLEELRTKLARLAFPGQDANH